jgi:hypothetical protein
LNVEKDHHHGINDIHYPAGRASWAPTSVEELLPHDPERIIIVDNLFRGS